MGRRVSNDEALLRVQLEILAVQLYDRQNFTWDWYRADPETRRHYRDMAQDCVKEKYP